LGMNWVHHRRFKREIFVGCAIVPFVGCTIVRRRGRR